MGAGTHAIDQLEGSQLVRVVVLGGVVGDDPGSSRACENRLR